MAKGRFMVELEIEGEVHQNENLEWEISCEPLKVYVQNKSLGEAEKAFYAIAKSKAYEKMKASGNILGI